MTAGRLAWTSSASLRQRSFISCRSTTSSPPFPSTSRTLGARLRRWPHHRSAGTDLAGRAAVPGAWMDRTGRRGFLLAGAAVYVVASLGYGVMRSVPGLLVWRVFHGLGLATFSTAAASLAADLAPPWRRGATMGAFGLAQAARPDGGTSDRSGAGDAPRLSRAVSWPPRARPARPSSARSSSPDAARLQGPAAGPRSERGPLRTLWRHRSAGGIQFAASVSLRHDHLVHRGRRA